MYDIKELEKEWKRYRRKKMRPWYVVVFLAVITGVSLFIFRGSITNVKLHEIAPKVEKKHHSTENIFLSPAISTLVEKKDIVPIDRPVETVVDDTIDKKDKKKYSKLHIEVIDSGSEKAYKEVEKRFRLSHDTDDSLFLAKAYYLRGRYKKAEYWALQTNKVNENIEESWLIFVKSKLKRKHKNEALRILKAYIDKTGSAEAKMLLKKIKKGMI